MAKYTISFLEYGRMLSEPYSTLNEQIENCRKKIFDFYYPLYKGVDKNGLERKIIRHYLMHEIGLETIGLFKLYFENKMLEIMPYYNELYRLQELLLNSDPEYDVDMYEDLIGSEESGKDRSSVQEGSEEDDTGQSLDEETSGTETNSATTSDNQDWNKDHSETSDMTANEDSSRNIQHEDSSRDTETYDNVTDRMLHDTTKANTGTQKNTGVTANSDFPQGNVSGNRDYYSDEQESESTRTDNLTEKMSGTDTNTKTGSITKAGSSNGESTETNNRENSSKDVRKGNESGHDGRERNEDAQSTKHGSREQRTLSHTEKNQLMKTLENIAEKLDRTQNKHTYGRSGSRTIASIVEEITAALKNIDMMIIDELKDLFMNVY